jgi:hypothetical protein
MRKLYKLLGIKLALSTAYHPQTDGQTEHVNQVIEGYLHTFTSRRQDDWDDFLPTGEFFYNNSKHLSTQQTPFMVDTRRHPRMGFEPQQPRCREWCPSAINSFELPSWMLYQDVQLLWDSGLVRGESGYSL